MGSSYRFSKYGAERAFLNRFATKEEFKGLLKPVDLTKDIELNGGGACFISDTKTAYVDNGDYHTLILGSTGSMKTRLFVFPTVFTLALAGENMLITDPKGEIYDRTSGFLKEKGYDIHVLNLRDMARSDNWNPLTEAYRLFSAGKTDEAIQVAYNFISALVAPFASKSQDAYWPDAAKEFLLGVTEILLRGAQKEEEVNISSLISFPAFCRSSGNSDDGLLLRRFASKLPDHCSIKEHITATVNNAPITMDCIMSFVAQAISPFVQSKLLQNIASSTTIDLHCFKDEDKKHAIYVIVPDENRTFHFFVASFIKQVYSVAVSDAFLCGNRGLHRRLNFILDEFANIPNIPDMPSMITAGRSRNIRFYLVIQSDNQLKENYKESAETIKTNCLSWVFLASKEGPLINQVQEMAGTRDRSHGSDPLISYFELTNLKKVFGPEGGAEAILLFARSKAYKTFLPDISRYEQFADIPPAELPYTQNKRVIFDIRKNLDDKSVQEVARIYSDVVQELDPHDWNRAIPIEE